MKTISLLLAVVAAPLLAQAFAPTSTVHSKTTTTSTTSLEGYNRRSTYHSENYAGGGGRGSGYSYYGSNDAYGMSNSMPYQYSNSNYYPSMMRGGGNYGGGNFYNAGNRGYYNNRDYGYGNGNGNYYYPNSNYAVRRSGYGWPDGDVSYGNYYGHGNTDDYYYRDMSYNQNRNNYGGGQQSYYSPYGNSYRNNSWNRYNNYSNGGGTQLAFPYNNMNNNGYSNNNGIMYSDWERRNRVAHRYDLDSHNPRWNIVNGNEVMNEGVRHPNNSMQWWN